MIRLKLTKPINGVECRLQPYFEAATQWRQSYPTWPKQVFFEFIKPHLHSSVLTVTEKHFLRGEKK